MPKFKHFLLYNTEWKHLLFPQQIPAELFYASVLLPYKETIQDDNKKEGKNNNDGGNISMQAFLLTGEPRGHMQRQAGFIIERTWL